MCECDREHYDYATANRREGKEKKEKRVSRRDQIISSTCPPIFLYLSLCKSALLQTRQQPAHRTQVKYTHSLIVSYKNL